MTPTFRLKVQQIQQTCIFELSWGQEQQHTATLAYPASLTALYREWQQAYLNFYQTAELPAAIVHPYPEDVLRGRVVYSGGIVSTVDWHAKLVEAETKLLNAFHHWLRSAELYEIRAAIARDSRSIEAAAQSWQDQKEQSLNVFLTCSSAGLMRFPWEAWEIGTDFAVTGTIRIIRTPANTPVEPSPRRTKIRQRARILAILGDDTGLDFQFDCEAVRSLSSIAEVVFIGWQPGKNIAEVKSQIIQAIAEEVGWDILFFAGHSNETAITGGELAIAPNTSIQISEIAPQLTLAKQRGLQFAVFNSCSGLNIAESLIGLGLSQVAVMREPIHNRVAQAFLTQFVRGLAQHKDVQEALLAACQFLRLEKNLTYPSAYLIPSLFCHPGAALFRIPIIEPLWKRTLRKVAPTRLEAAALAACLVLGVMPQVQDFLLDRRIWAQSIYRDITGQIPDTTTPPVLLVQIDEESVREIPNPNPMDRSYLAALINRLSDFDAKVVGVDYLLDRNQPENDAIISEAVQAAVDQHQTWFVFAVDYRPGEGEVGLHEDLDIRKTWSMEGAVDLHPDLMLLLDPADDCREVCPFAYLLSLIQASNSQNISLQPQLSSEQDLRTQLIDTIEANPQSDELKFLLQARLSQVHLWARNWLNQIWLQPIIDYSIPPTRVYDRVAAWGLLDSNQELDLPRLSEQIVIIAQGGYSEAYVDIRQSDNYPLPSAMNYWRHHLPHSSDPIISDKNPVNSSIYPDDTMTGAEAHAYMIHHFLNQRLVIPIPDLWMIGIAVLLGRGIRFLIVRQRCQQPWTHKQQLQYRVSLASITVFYGWLTLQLYVSATVLLPWLLPSSIVWIYILPTLRRQKHV